MRYVTLGEVVELHRRLIQTTGGAAGIRDSARWNSQSPSRRPPSMVVTCIRRSMRRPRRSVGPSFRHPFIDGNKRVGHAAMETFFVLNGSEMDASVDVQERVMLDLAAGQLDHRDLTDWIRQHLKSLG